MPVWDADKNAVKHDLGEFRKDPAKLQQYIKNAFEFGYFNILDQARVSGSMTAALFQHEYRRYHDALLPETREARKVIFPISAWCLIAWNWSASRDAKGGTSKACRLCPITSI
jgi:hypothetical protein